MDISQLQQQLTEYLLAGEYDNAIAFCEQSIYANSSLRLNYWYLGLAKFLQGEESEAQAVWLSVITEGTPDEIDEWTAELLEVLEALANQFLNKRKLPLAESIYWQILELDDTNYKAYYNLANALAQQGNYDEAIDLWSKAIDINSNLIEAYENQGSVWQKLGNFAEASDCYLKALAIRPNHQITYNLALCLLNQGRSDQAIAYFQTTLQLEPDYTPAYGDLGYILLQERQLNQAVIFFKKAIKQDFIRIYIKWLNKLVEQGNLQENLKENAIFLEALNINTETFETYFSLGKLLTRENKFDLAVDAYQKAIYFKESAEAYFELGKTVTETENFESAIAIYQKAIKLQPKSAYFYFYLAKSQVEIGNLDEAIANYQKALSINPDLSEIYLNLGYLMLRIDRIKDAIAYYEKHLDWQPNSLDACWHLAIALAEDKQNDRASAYFQKVMQVNPDMAIQIFNIINHLYPEDVKFRQILPIQPPNAFYESTWDWAIKYNLEKTNYFPIYPSNTVNLSPPLTPEKFIHFSFRFGSKVELPASFVAIVPEGRYWLNKNQDKSAVITPDNHFLADISPDFPVLSPGHPDKHPSNHSILRVSSKLPPIQKIDGTVAVLSGLLNDLYFHWMFDILPRLELLHKSGINLSDIDKFLISSHLPFQRETLNLLGISENKILPRENYPHIQATKLVVPSFPGTIAWMPKWACDFLRSTFLNQKNIQNIEKIDYLYISRQDATNRRIINEEAVVNCLSKFGFRTVTLESMSVVEQAALFANAKVVVSPHGSGLTNTVFCSPSTKVIEIFSPNYVYPCYWLISNLVNLEYYYLIGENSLGQCLHQLLYPNPRLEDIFVNIDELVHILNFAKVI